ncbi:MAG: hypothetical protein CVV25_03450 [Ignavibacteriae bacterium HGW-Ignavibacteriae-4]|nr:MAG: hypothetical protein CVV25_03450 [Ignavibacteriae bacterium HGW-Ignavibacteriae-4]
MLIESERVALSQIGVREVGNNRGEVVKYLASVGLGEGHPYCAAGVYWGFSKAAVKLNLSKSEIPIRRTAVANAILNDAISRGKRVDKPITRHDLLVWKSKSSWQGHIERVIETKSRGIVKTIAFNVKLSDGEGVGIKTRYLSHPLGKLMLRGVIKFEVKDDN